MIAITKADGHNEGPARHAAADYRAVLGILTPADAAWQPPVITVSALSARGLEELWAHVTRHRAAFEATGEFAAKRRDQDVHWMQAMIEERVRQMYLGKEEASAKIQELEHAVRLGLIPPSVAADEAAATIFGCP
jgi:LAO/AO transport system kinase